MKFNFCYNNQNFNFGGKWDNNFNDLWKNHCDKQIQAKYDKLIRLDYSNIKEGKFEKIMNLWILSSLLRNEKYSITKYEKKVISKLRRELNPFDFLIFKSLKNNFEKYGYSGELYFTRCLINELYKFLTKNHYFDLEGKIEFYFDILESELKYFLSDNELKYLKSERNQFIETQKYYISFKRKYPDYLKKSNKKNNNLIKKEKYAIEMEDEEFYYVEYSSFYYNISNLLKFDKKENPHLEEKSSYKKIVDKYIENELLSEEEYIILFKNGIDPCYILKEKIKSRKALIKILKFFKTKKSYSIFKYYRKERKTSKYSKFEKIVDIYKIRKEVFFKLNHDDFDLFNTYILSSGGGTLLSINNYGWTDEHSFIMLKKFYQKIDLNKIGLNSDYYNKLSNKLKRRIYLSIKENKENLKQQWLKDIVLEFSSREERIGKFKKNVNFNKGRSFKDITELEKIDLLNSTNDYYEMCNILSSIQDENYLNNNFYYLLSKMKKNKSYHSHCLGDAFKINNKIPVERIISLFKNELKKYPYAAKERIDLLFKLIKKDKLQDVIVRLLKWIESSYYQPELRRLDNDFYRFLFNKITKKYKDISFIKNNLYPFRGIFSFTKVNPYFYSNSTRIFIYNNFSKNLSLEELNRLVYSLPISFLKNEFKMKDLYENPNLIEYYVCESKKDYVLEDNIIRGYFYNSILEFEKTDFLDIKILKMIKRRKQSFMEVYNQLKFNKMISKDILSNKKILEDSKLYSELCEIKSKVGLDNLQYYDYKINSKIFSEHFKMIIEIKRGKDLESEVYNFSSFMNREYINIIDYREKEYFKIYLERFLKGIIYRYIDEKKMEDFEKSSLLLAMNFSDDVFKDYLFYNYEFKTEEFKFINKLFEKENILKMQVNATQLTTICLDKYYPKRFKESLKKYLFIHGKFDPNILNLWNISYNFMKANEKYKMMSVDSFNKELRKYKEYVFPNLVESYKKMTKKLNYKSFDSKVLFTNYSLKKCLKMYREYKGTQDVVSFINDISNLYFEIRKMKKDYNLDFSKYNSLMKIHNQLNSYYQALKFFNKKMPRKQFIKKGICTKNFKIVKPNTKRELFEWGKLLNNCIGTYWKRLLINDVFILGVLDNKNNIKYTIEILDGEIYQFQGKYRSELNHEKEEIYTALLNNNIIKN